MTQLDRCGRAMRISAIALAVAAALGHPVYASAQESTTAPQSVATELYVINFESTTLPIKPSDRPSLAELKGHTLYVVPIDIRGVTWYRLRMGFFGSKKEAEALLAQYEGQFPDGWVARVDQDELAFAKSGAQAHAPTLPDAPAAGAAADANGDRMRQAHDAMLMGDYPRAVRLYTEVLKTPANPYSQDAQELLGLARERSGQTAQARTEYETYLKLYPQGEGNERVRQRLLGLVTAREANSEVLRAAHADNGNTGWRGYGSISQYVRWDQYSFGGVTTSDTLYITDLDYTVRRRGTDYDVRGRFSGQYWPSSNSTRNSDGRISTLYGEAVSMGNGFSGSLGRQSRSDSGVMGRFDGGIVSKPFGSGNRVNLLAGAPVEWGYQDRINSHKQFYGVSVDMGQIAGGFDTNTYFLQQQVDGIVDRQGIGAEVRYIKEGRSLFAMVDYDASYSTVNTALALAGWAAADGKSFNLIVDYRKTPMLSTSNALIGQNATTITDLLHTFTEKQIRQLALDRTALSRSATASATLPLNNRFQAMLDVTVYSISGTPASGDTSIDPLTGLPAPGSVMATPPTGTQTYYSAQILGNDLWKAGDSTIFGVRYSSEEHATTTSFMANYRRPVAENIYLNPRARVDYRKDSVIGDENAFFLGLRATSQFRKDLWIEGEVSGEWRDHKVYSGNGSMNMYVIYAGIRKDF